MSADTPSASLRDRVLLSRLVILLAFVSPMLAIAVVSNFILPRGLLDGVEVPGPMYEETSAILSSLMGDLINLAIGIAVASWFLYRQTVISSARARHIGFVLCIWAISFVSLFSGLRGQYALAFIISTQPFAIQKISPFIQTQSVCLALGFMFLTADFAHFMIYRDHRSKLREK
jgi:hypothetical protein